MKFLNKTVIYTLALIFSFVFQSQLKIFGTSPHYLLLIMVLVTNEFSGVGHLFLAFGLGLLIDVADGRSIGLSAGAMVAAYLVARALSKRIYADKIFVSVIVVFAASLSFSLFKIGAHLYLGDSLIEDIVKKTLLESFFTTALVPLYFLIFKTNSRTYSGRSQIL